MRHLIALVLVLSACFDPPPRPAPLADTDTDAPTDTDAFTDTDLPPSPYTLALGPAHVCALDRAGAATCWGDGEHGRLGALSAQPGLVTPEPLAAPPLTRIAAGRAHGAGLTTSGEVVLWGDNRRAQVGTADPLVWRPRVVTRAAAVALGRDTTCVVDADAVRCWGEPLDADTRPDNVNAPERPAWLTPIPVPGLSTAYALALGDHFGCALTDPSAPAVRCFGSNQRGQLGHVTPIATTVALPTLAAAADPWTTLAAGAAFACTLSATAIACWGDNRRYQAGDPSGTPTAAPHHLDLGAASDLVDLALGARHGCVRTRSGEVHCWGDNSRGQCASPDPGGPTLRRVALDAPALHLAAGGDTTCATTATTIVCWGDNSAGQLTPGAAPADPALAFSTEPIAVALDPAPPPAPTCTTTPACTFCDIDPTCAPPTHLVAGADHTCALFADAPPTCWGRGGDGRLGRADEPPYASPARATFPSNALAAGGATTCALAAGVVVCGGALPSPDLVATTVAVDATRACAIEPAGVIACWGPSGAITRTTLDAAPTQLALAGPSTCAATPAGVTCWGTNDFGQLGRGTRSPSEAPGLVPDLATPDLLVGAGRRFCALSASTLRCWGANDRGALGLPSDIDLAPSPVVVHPTLAATHVALGPTTTCALTTTQLFCWGDNRASTLALGPTSIGTPEPHRVRLPFLPVALAVGRAHACAAGAGRVACWGDDSEGQLGHGLPGLPTPTPTTP